MGGKEGGTGTKPKATVTRKKEPEQDLSSSPRPRGSLNWSCPFPPEADAAQQNYARVTLVVTVGTDGRAKSVSVISDPGFGFGRAAKRCALRKNYSVGKDRTGKPVAKSSGPMVVTFTR